MYEEEFPEALGGGSEDKLEKVEDRVVFSYIAGTNLALPLLLEYAAPPLAEQLEDGVEDFADDILCLGNPLATEVAVVGVLATEVVNHAEDASCHLPLCFLPVKQPLRGFHPVY